MAALDTLTTPRAAPDLHVEPTHDGPHEEDIFWILRRDAGYVGSTATAQVRRGDRSRVGLIDARRNRPSGSASIGGAGSSPWLSAMALWTILRERCGLAEARPSRGVRLLLEALVLALQSITVALGLAPLLFDVRHFLTQVGDVVLLAPDQIVTFVLARSRALVGHARVMPYRRKRSKYDFLDLAPSHARTAKRRPPAQSVHVSARAAAGGNAGPAICQGCAARLNFLDFDEIPRFSFADTPRLSIGRLLRSGQLYGCSRLRSPPSCGGGRHLER